MKPTTRRSGARWIAVLAVVLASATCSHGAVLSGKLDGVHDIIVQAEANGAYRCAPVQLAMAKSHEKFARLELKEGYLSRAKKHFALSETNAEEAYKLSPPEKCAPKGVKVEVPDIPVVPKVGDRDGDGCKDDVDPCPDDPEDLDAFEDDDCCPEDQDTDGDGIKDFAKYCFKPEDGDCTDLCVLEPEDPDGYMDDDGCPDPDNDADGILDDGDKCPNDPEDPDGFEDEDGCPDADNDEDEILDVDDKCPLTKGVPEEDGCPAKPKIEGVIIKDKKIEILEKIYFAFNKAIIKPESYGILNKVVKVLEMYPEIKIEVQGHTDSKGNDFYNYCLSQARAKSVMNYLIAHGIPAYRLSSVGYGESCAVDTNATPDGRANNRRVEFIRTDVDEIERACPIPEPPTPKKGKKKKKKCKKFKVYEAY